MGIDDRQPRRQRRSPIRETHCQLALQSTARCRLVDCAESEFAKAPRFVRLARDGKPSQSAVVTWQAARIFANRSRRCARASTNTNHGKPVARGRNRSKSLINGLTSSQLNAHG